mmetsp:Transcript_19838/g.32911  ORF Transcript_19838/g.32911 Transcript_19838/m.32911 type:complete len:114 (+) Transcript_19838:82-423(+)
MTMTATISTQQIGVAALAALSMVASVMAFAPPTTNVVRNARTALSVVTDPATVTNKEYEDICGISFGEDEMMNRLEKTSYLYPKHVEVIEDLAPLAGQMVDDIVSNFFPCWFS